MSISIKIAIIGDFNFTFETHHATNLALEYSADMLGMDIDYYWIRLYEAADFKPADFQKFDGIWFAPGPYDNSFFLNEIIKKALKAYIPIFITGASYRKFVKVLIHQYNLNPEHKKVISENLINGAGGQLKKFEVNPLSGIIQELYPSKNYSEVSNVHYSIYPEALTSLLEVVDIEAVNQFNDPTIISLKSREFCLATMNLPQVSSTSSAPHPLISAFLNYIKNAMIKAS